MKKFLINLKYAYRPNKPKLISRLVKNMVEVYAGKMPLRYVDFSIGYKCNLSCSHCFANHEDKNGKLTPAEYSVVVKEAMKIGAVNFSFQGGEPLLYPELKEYIFAARPEKNLISLSTNGTLLNWGKMRELSEMGVDILTISYDPFHRPVDILSIMDMAQHFRINITISTVVTHAMVSDNIINLGKLAGICTKNKTILMLIYAAPIGRWKDNKDVMLNKVDLEIIKKITREYQYVRTDFDANYKAHGCGAAKEIIYIRPNGDVLCCPFLETIFGNVRKESIIDIRKKMLTNNLLSKYHNECLAISGGL